MKIIHVDTGRDWRGGQSQVLMLSSGLSSAGYDSMIVSRRAGALAERARQSGQSVKELAFRFEADIPSAVQLKRIASEGSDVIVHTHTPHALGIALIAKRLGMRRPILFTRRVSFPIKKTYINRWKINQADRIIAVSKAVSNELASAGIDPEKTKVVHSAFDPESFPYTTHSSDPPYGIAVLGAIEKAKGLEDALLLREHLRKVPVVFHFFGGGKDHSYLLNKIHGDSGIVAHGFVGDVGLFLQQMFLAVSLSPAEGFPNLVMQAMATGLPVVAMSNPSVVEMIESEKVGFVAGSVQEMADRIRKLMDNPDASQRVGKAASQYVHSRFCVKHMVRDMLNIYQEVIK